MHEINNVYIQIYGIIEVNEFNICICFFTKFIYRDQNYLIKCKRKIDVVIN